MDRSKIYAERLSRIESDFKRDNNLQRAIERVTWKSNIPIWWLEEFAPNWAQQAETYEQHRSDQDVKQEIRKSVPRDRTCGSVTSFRISLPRSFIREEQEFKYD